MNAARQPASSLTNVTSGGETAAPSMAAAV